MGYEISHKTVLAAQDAGQPGDTSPCVTQIRLFVHVLALFIRFRCVY